MKENCLQLEEEKVCLEVPNWDYLINEIQSVFKLNEFERKRLETSMTAKLIAFLPYASGAKDADRTAIAHLCIYIAEKKGFQRFCAHVPSDDDSPFTRLEQLSNFNGGDKNVIDHGMTILACIMLEGYRASQKIDLQNGVYNPLNSGVWDYEKIKHSLEYRLASTKCSLLDNWVKLWRNYGCGGW